MADIPSGPDDDVWYAQKGRDTFDAWLLTELLAKVAQQQPDPQAYLSEIQANIETGRDRLYFKPFPAELEGFNRRFKQILETARNKIAS